MSTSAFGTWREQFDALGVARQEVEIKVFGGADVLPGIDGRRRADRPSAP